MKKVLPILGLSLLMVACGNQTQGTNPENSGATTNTPENNQIMDNNTNMMNNKQDNLGQEKNNLGTTDNSGSAALEGEITNESLVQAFLDKYPQGEVTSISYEKEMNKEVYSVEGFEADKEVEILVDGTSGEISQGKEETEDDQDDKKEALDLENIKEFKEAIEIAKQESTEQEVESFDLSKDKGKAVYEIEFKGSEKEIILDAMSLEIVEKDA